MAVFHYSVCMRARTPVTRLPLSRTLWCYAFVDRHPPSVRHVRNHFLSERQNALWIEKKTYRYTRWWLHDYMLHVPLQEILSERYRFRTILFCVPVYCCCLNVRHVWRPSIGFGRYYNFCIYFPTIIVLIYCDYFWTELIGCGFIGRNMVKYLVDNNLASFIRVVDKVPPQIAWLNDDHKKAFESSSVEFHSANLIYQGKISYIHTYQKLTLKTWFLPFPLYRSMWKCFWRFFWLCHKLCWWNTSQSTGCHLRRRNC